MSVSIVRNPDAPQSETPTDSKEAPKPSQVNGDVLKGVRVSLQIHLGNATMTVEELMALKTGSVVPLDASLSDPVELFLNETLIARGEVVAVGDKYGVRLMEIVSAAP